MDDEYFTTDGADQHSDPHHDALEPDADTTRPQAERVGFGYDVLPEPMAARLRQTVIDIHEAHAAAIDAIAKIGNSLIAARTLLVRHGEFTFWVNAEFNWTLRTAQRYMNAARFLEGKATSMSLLPAHLIYRIAAPSADPEIVQDVVEAAEAGAPLTVKEIEKRLDATVQHQRREPRENPAHVWQSSVLTQDPVDTEPPLATVQRQHNAEPARDPVLIAPPYSHRTDMTPEEIRYHRAEWAAGVHGMGAEKVAGGVRPPDTAKVKLRKPDSPAAENWHAALRALRTINEQAPVEALFLSDFDRSPNFNHVFYTELENAVIWMGSLYAKFKRAMPEAEPARRRSKP